MPQWGASQQAWEFFSYALKLAGDLLPVVSNPSAAISPRSSLKTLGKTPSLYGADGLVIGLRQWSERVSSPEDIAEWAAQPDYGICVQTRRVRALDIDIDDPLTAGAIADMIEQKLGLLPVRRRGDSGKFLVMFEIEGGGEYFKRIIRTEHGIIEFLAQGQQFIAHGTHPKGERYRWENLYESGVVPSVSAEAFESLWDALKGAYAIESHTAQPRKDGPHTAVPDDVVGRLDALGWGPQGQAYIRCPFEHEHTTESNPSATAYFPAGTRGYEQGHFVCLHAHCANRDDADFLDALGLRDDMFEPLGEDEDAPKSDRFKVIGLADFASRPAPSWLIKDVMPKAELMVCYGESGSGKSFFMLDMVAAVARGLPWRGRRTRQGRVVYVAAEGAGGFRNRVLGYCRRNGVALGDLPLGVIDTAPNLMTREEASRVAASVREWGGADVIVIDTLAQTTPGANENAGEDMGKALAHCKAIHRATGALIVLVHHSGKDAARGARGWSGIKAAADAEIEITRDDNGYRQAQVTKMKDGSDGGIFAFGLEPITIGIDEDGDTITSCFVVGRESGSRSTPVEKPKQIKLGQWETLVLETFNDMTGLTGDSLSLVQLVEAAAARLPADSRATARDRRREYLRRAVDSLVLKSFLQVSDEGNVRFPVSSQ